MAPPCVLVTGFVDEVVAAKKSSKAKAKTTKAPGTKRRRGVAIRPTELGALDLADVSGVEGLSSLAERVEQDGGAVLAKYREPLGGHGLLLVALPIEKVSPTPFQRDVSDAHVRKLTRAMDKTKRFLDPLIVVAADGTFWTPNGNDQSVPEDLRRLANQSAAVHQGRAAVAR
jgi:ParB family transcriptional regulator, chromosome partitioning protein